ncbi:hypothetical protein Bhyg_02270 [Pseudolycoriella hygida]|uniref:Uncharacterized protein n=1 Tax=Pseudolycoriella hygida TaxID=35572 RepID=A0A9Q0NBQ6_9DIPT|nr:hypothetical protein Bhyg_02270 [Pseudolycoriella hygida]
MLSSSQLWLH